MKKLMLLTGILSACALSQALPLFNVSIYAGGAEQTLLVSCLTKR